MSIDGSVRQPASASNLASSRSRTHERKRYHWPDEDRRLLLRR